LNHLIASKHAYRCFCSQERLINERERATQEQRPSIYDRKCIDLPQSTLETWLSQSRPHTVRLRMSDGKTTLNDMVYGQVTFEHRFIDDPVLMKSDGYPTYHYANVIDDYCMKISHVLRGEVEIINDDLD
jgi:glutamyl/glutaminyl-tRNA synthetase